MTRQGRAAGAAVPVAVLVAVLAGCGVQPTGVVDAGEPATGLTKGLRLYYARDARLQGVPRPDTPVTNLDSVIKLLSTEPTPAEQERGLSNLVRVTGAYEATGSGDRITLRIPGTDLAGERNRLAVGQLVCSLARAQGVLHEEVRPDDVQVTIDGVGAPLGPYQCSQFPHG
ncbi:GerMN domain-containing protein [Streptomyces sp. NPDC054841]